ncbi:TonB-dependent receptor [Persicobacter diffluens]|uniref:TonB-dependent receptor n=1 Tax=Persicobacter diffluens TaxID=981 RepID=A0AAN4VZR9_9BACT|nr:TonB-dependent receptor [Persicobacter diffluens]
MLRPPLIARFSFVFIIAFFILFKGVFAQSKITISGYLSDARTGEHLIGASVYDQKSGNGAVTNAYGFYSLTIAPDSVDLYFSYVGYQNERRHFLANESKRLNLRLSSDLLLKEITVEAPREDLPSQVQMSTIELPLADIKQVPALFGEVDVLKVIQLLPGVQSGTEGTSGLYVRGGGPDQNLILLDGVPLYNASHLLGFFSVFNADAINKVDLIKGGFPARYGGRISSVIDVKMKEGNDQEFQGAGAVGLISSKFSLEGPLKKEQSSFIISGRRTYLDLVARPFMPKNNKAGYYFYDTNAKFNFKLGDKDRLYFSGYFGRDKGFGGTKSDYEDFDLGLYWGNVLGTVRWNHLFNDRLFSNLSFNVSDYQFRVGFFLKDRYGGEEQEMNLVYLSGIQDYTLRYDFDFIPSPQHYIRFGMQSVFHRFRPGVFDLDGDEDLAEINIKGSDQVNSMEYTAYVEDEWKIHERFSANFGVNATFNYVQDHWYPSIQPRVSARYLVNRDWSWKASYAQMNQNLHLLTSSAFGLPTDLWVPVTQRVKPQEGHQWALGTAFSKGKLEYSLEGYYKKMNNVVEYREGASFFNFNGNWEDLVTSGQAWSYGLELLIQKKVGKTTGWLGYTWSKSMRQFDDINLGDAFPYKYDRRHDISLVVNHELGKKWSLSGTFVYGTGNAISLPVRQLQPPADAGYGGEINEYGGRNSFRMPAYHRMDLSLTHTKQKRWGERSWVISVYNVYNRKNVFFVDPFYSSWSGGYDAVTLFPIIPSISYNFKF